MNTNVYEGLFILDSDMYAKNAEEVSGQIDQQIAQFGGEVLVSRFWEEKKLAYPIKGHKRGTYWLTYFKLDTSKVKDLNRQYQISNGIVRFLFQRIDPRLVDTLVEHAKTGPIRPVVEEQTENDVVTSDVFEEENKSGEKVVNEGEKTVVDEK